MKKYRAFVSWGPLAAAVLLIAVSACSPSQPSSPGGRAQPESSAPAPELDDSYTAEVDPSTGIVRLPITVALGLPGRGLRLTVKDLTPTSPSASPRQVTPTSLNLVASSEQPNGITLARGLKRTSSNGDTSDRPVQVVTGVEPMIPSNQ